MTTTHPLPGLPELGHPEHYYCERGREADHRHDRCGHDAMKVGMYVTRALHHEVWEEKLRCLEHALKHHCFAPPNVPEAVVDFYNHMGQMVREKAGVEALRLASSADDRYAARLAAGERRDHICHEARPFFRSLLPTEHRPEWMNFDDFEQLRILKHQWE